MVIKFKHLLLLIIVASTGLSVVQPEKPGTGFWAMEGTLVTHYFEETNDALSGPELFELRDSRGVPVWFGRHIHKDVCISGVCKMIRLWLFWDGAGNYLGLQVPEDEPLTKSDHTLFEQADYEKLESILRDTASILKDLKQEDLIIVPDSIDPYEVDGYTAATQPTLAESVVRDAVYTCHTLWHTLYGPVQDTIFRILENRISDEYLEKMFSGQNAGYVYWAIEALEKHPGFHHRFYPDVLGCIPSDDPVLAKKALDYFNPQFLEDTAVQVRLTEVLPAAETGIKYEILWKLTGAGKLSETAVVNLLQMFQNEQIGTGAYNILLKLITDEHIRENQQIALLIRSLAENENAYVRNLTARKLEKIK